MGMRSLIDITRRASARRWSSRDRRTSLRGTLFALVAACVALAWVLTLRPASLGGPASYVLVSGDSMEPALHDGDLVIARRHDAYAVGDIVAYRIPADEVGGGLLIIHRITGGNATRGFVLQGDNRDASDLWRPRREDILGQRLVIVPKGARLIFLLRTPIAAATLAGIIAFLITVRSAEAKSRSSSGRPRAHCSSGGTPDTRNANLSTKVSKLEPEASASS